MSLAKPLMYTRGTPIHLQLRCTEEKGFPDISSLRIALVHTFQTTQEGSPRSQKCTVNSGSSLKTVIANAVFILDRRME